MKKVLNMLLVVGCIVAFLAFPIQSSAASNKGAEGTFQSYTKQINDYMVVYANREVPPSTYYYNVGGWSGTLRLEHWQSTGSGVIAYYSGKVRCAAPCPM
ncbi:hypothetical protein [Virgibacillus chiguensis]|uniref:Uncharacterized protein n=1 Tax=Virgibacillus chiguensis TaxID=411959 RepID=A0A1M5WQT8_9BACI|nr:hypothetical protein [Virgibacillus chiguensis]SHH89966.1 hypothetical protein SAMN05421807_11827 [Virgibacillus chiguensis]